MHKHLKWLSLLVLAPLLMANEGGCDVQKSSDDIQRQQQERILQEGTSQVGMPAIKNFREKKLLKDIYELRDQSGLVTYTYLSNEYPNVIKGHTSLGGKITFFCESFGYPIPYSTQFTNPQKMVGESYHAVTTIAQADPNGLFSPSSTSGTWVMCKDPNPGGKEVKPLHVEANVIGSPFRFPLD
jgi:hypothetical protein